MDQTEFQQLIKSKLERDCPHTAVIYRGVYDGCLTFALIPEHNPKFVGYAATGFPVYALVRPGDFEGYRLVSDLDLKITDHFFPPEQRNSSDERSDVYDLTIKF